MSLSCKVTEKRSSKENGLGLALSSLADNESRERGRAWEGEREREERKLSNQMSFGFLKIEFIMFLIFGKSFDF